LAGNYITQPVQSAAGSYTANVEGGLYYETDRGVYYVARMVSNVATWVYQSGYMSVVQASLPTGLGASDAGFLAWVTDYGHILQWSGSAWGWAPGEQGSGMDVFFEVDPTGVGWHLVDGSTVSYLKANGTLGSVTLPNLSGTSPSPSFLVAGTPNSGVTAPVNPVLSGSATFTGTPLAAHSHDAPIGIDGSDNIYALDVNGNGSTYTAEAKASGASNSTTQTSLKTSAVSGGTPAGTISLSGVSASAGAPQSITRRMWFRQ
jgi:hypothetical protein